MASPPQVKHYKALSKSDAGVRYFPCWTLDELKAAKPQVDPATVEELFLKWGGVARYVFSPQQRGLEADLHKAVTGLDLSLVFMYMTTPEVSEGHEMISHILVQYCILERGDMPF